MLLLSCSVSVAVGAWMAHSMLFDDAAPPASAGEWFYAAHTLLELALGLMKLRGRYQHEADGVASPLTQMCVRPGPHFRRPTFPLSSP
jgi:hypothetical protein